MPALEPYEQIYVALGVADKVGRDPEYLGYAVQDLCRGTFLKSYVLCAQNKERHIVPMTSLCLELVKWGADVHDMAESLDLATPLATSRDAMGLEIPIAPKI